jgi:uncharacterized protein (DUF983 family)
MIVGHLVIGPLLLSDAVFTWPIEWLMALVLPSIVVLALVLLPRVKGAFVGVQWAVGDRSGAHPTESPTATLTSTETVA